MKTDQFIREFGEKATKEVVEHAPEWADVYLVPTSEYASIDVPVTETDDFVAIHNLESFIESLEIINRIGIKHARKAIEGNKLDASYYQPSTKSYFRYGHNSIYTVRDGEWKEIYGGMDSSTLIHTDGLKQAIRDYDAVYGT